MRSDERQTIKGYAPQHKVADLKQKSRKYKGSSIIAEDITRTRNDCHYGKNILHIILLRGISCRDSADFSGQISV